MTVRNVELEKGPWVLVEFESRFRIVLDCRARVERGRDK